MSWLPMILLALAAFGVAALVLRLPRAGWSLFGAALLFGLAGYAFQGQPGYGSAPKSRTASDNSVGPALIEARRALFDPSMPPSYYITLSDGFARKGQFADAAGLLQGAVEDNPQDTEAWLALGNALIEHAEGVVTPAALYAYRRAEETDPDHPGPPYFLGIAYLRSGEPDRTRAVWVAMIDSAPDDAPWLPDMRMRLDALDRLLSSQPPENAR